MDIKITKNKDKFDVLLLSSNHGKECKSISEVNEYIKEQGLNKKNNDINIYIDKTINDKEYYKIINFIKKK